MTNKNINKFIAAGAFLFLLVATPAQAALYNATAVYGQPDFTTGTYNLTNVQSGTAFGQGTGIYDTAFDYVNHRLFVADYYSNRVMVYQLNASNDLASASPINVLGQNDFTGIAATTARASTSPLTGLNSPFAVAYDSDNMRLFVADYGNSRILVYDANPSTLTNGQAALITLHSKTDYDGFGGITDPETSPDDPESLAYDSVNKRLFVSDGARVLVHDANPATMTSFQKPTAVLGQETLLTRTTAMTQSGMNYIQGLAYDSANERLLAGDYSYTRVTTYDVNPSTMTNGENAINIIGQPNYTTNSYGSSQTLIDGPYKMAYDSESGMFFMSDSGNNRIMVYDIKESPFTDNPLPIEVIGQSDYTTNASGVTAASYNRPVSVQIDQENHRLLIGDSANMRLLQVPLIHITTSSLPAISLNSTYTASIGASGNNGTLSYELYDGELPPGLALDTSTGDITGTPTTAGTYNFTIQANDTSSTGKLIARKAYGLTIASAAAAPEPEAPATRSGSRPKSSGIHTSIPVENGNGNSEQLSEVAKLQQQIQDLLAQVAKLKALLPTSTSTPRFTRTLKIGDEGEDVRELQKFLNSKGFIVASSGPGSIGNETTQFGTLTRLALGKFQEANREQILVPAGLSHGTGDFGPMTMKFVNSQE